MPAYAKVNLGLEVLGVRQDGYHELRTLFQTIDLHDDLHLAPTRSGVKLACDHPGVPLDETNLAARAARLLQDHARARAGVEIRITKRIPVAAGLGGGSSDAAAVLLALDRLWGLGLGSAGLQPFARRLGADVPFFLIGGTALGLARGDEVYPLHRQIDAPVLVVDLGRLVPTAAVFAKLDARLTPRENGHTIYRFVSCDLEGVSAYSALSNELEEAAFEVAPDLADRVRLIRGILVREGARLALLSGSGSSVFGLFADPRPARQAQAALARGGYRSLLGRTLTLDQYRGVWSRSFGAARTRSRPGKERTTWRSRTSRSSRWKTRS